MKPAERPLFHTARKRPYTLAAPSAAPDEPSLTVAGLPPGMGQKILAATTAAALFAAFIAVAKPLSGLRFGEAEAFLPACGTAIVVNNAVTAALLFAQFAITRSRALLVIACGYLFTALMVIPWILTSPGIASSDGIFGTSPQATSWLFLFWHAGFPFFVIGYALLDDADRPAWAPHRPGLAIGGASLIIVAAAIVATLLTTRGSAALPVLLRDELHPSITGQSLSGGAALLTILALAILGRRLRSVLDLWLMVVMCAYLIQLLLVCLPLPARFTIGWYSGQLFGLFAGSLVLIVLLCEITALYARLFAALHAQRREHEARLLTGNAVAAMIAHEVKQPLTGITTHAQAGLRWLDRPTPELEEARETLRQIAAHGLRAGQMIDDVRAIFRHNTQNRVSLAPDSLIADVLAGLRPDLQFHRICVQTASDPDLPTIIGDPSQLHQCFANLVTNAIDAMAETSGPRILSVHASFRDGSVRISFADNGPGIRPEDADRIFNPLFTSKPHGMGMGLAICRSIIASHDGKLWVAPNPPRGAIFHVALRANA
jgi:signal transduction histidine kinase